MPLDGSSQEYKSFMTPNGIYTPTGVLYGTKNAVAYLQSWLSGMLREDVRKNLLHCLDDILLYAAIVTEILGIILEIYKLRAVHNNKQHLQKYLFFAANIS